MSKLDRNATIAKLIADGVWPYNKELVVKQAMEYKGVLEEHFHLVLIYSGKVADIYYIGLVNGEHLCLIVRSDRVSIFDRMLTDKIRQKGCYLTQIINTNDEILKKMFPGIKTSIVAKGIDIYDYISSKHKQEDSDLHYRAQVIRLSSPYKALINGFKTEMEWIFRNHMTGSLFKAYKEGKEPYGLGLSSGLKEWDKFDTPIFTPTTKDIADTPIEISAISNKEQKYIMKLREIFSKYSNLLEQNGIVLVDTKFEISADKNGEMVLIDEFLTPDSSRFIRKKDFEAGDFVSLDKQVIRNWGESIAIKQKSKEGDIFDCTIPGEVKTQTLSAYAYILSILAVIEKEL